MAVMAPPEPDQAPADRNPARASLLVALAVVAGAIVFYLGMLLGSSSDIPANTTVLGVQIGGMSRAEAVAALERDLGPRAAAPVSISAFGTSEEILPADSGLSFDPIATADAAEGRVYNPVSMVMRVFGPTEIAPVVIVDEAALSSRLAGFGEMVARPSAEPSIHYDGVEPVLNAAEEGREIDLPSATGVVADAYLGSGEDVALPEVIIAPAVSTDQAEEFRSGPATLAVSAPVTIQVESVSPQVQPETIAEATHYLVEGGQLVAQVDGALIHASIATELAPVESPGNDATFEINADNIPVVVPSKVGSGVSDPDLAAAVAEAMLKEGAERTASPPVTVRDPVLTTADAMQLGVVEEISSFTQEVNYAEYMAHNLALASKYINGTLLLPGDVFSMNEKTENHDPENGYMEGYVIGPGGIFQKALGGGLSAATTTMWSAAFYAGLEPVEVQAHSIYISRYVPGLEATVAWEGFDMKFRNDTPYGVFITATSDETSMTVRMYSTKVYTDVKAEVGDRYAITPFKTIYNDSPECSDQSGGEGFTIDVDRIFYEGTTEVNRETFTTTYSPAPQVICGKKPKPEKPSDEDATSQSPSPEPTATDVPSDEPSGGGPTE